MTDKVDIWMPLYVRDYIGATSRLTTEQHGAYLLLIMDYWLNGPPPDDDHVLASIVRLPLEQWQKHRPSIERLFSVHSGAWTHKRIDREIEAAHERKTQAIERGKRGAMARWGKDDKASNGASIDQACKKQSSKDSSSPSPSPKKKTKSKAAGAAVVDLPDWMPLESWSDFLDYRKEIKSPMSTRAQEMAIKKLEKFKKSGDDPVEVLEQSMINGWKGLFQVKEPNRNNEPGPTAPHLRTLS